MMRERAVLTSGNGSECIGCRNTRNPAQLQQTPRIGHQRLGNTPVKFRPARKPEAPPIWTLERESGPTIRGRCCGCGAELAASTAVARLSRDNSERCARREPNGSGKGDRASLIKLAMLPLTPGPTTEARRSATQS